MATKFAIWIAVSTEAQATNGKDSLPEQEKRCRAVGLSKGWRDSGKLYSVPGESRTRYVNLRDAESAIPPLHEMLEDAKSRAFDILVIYDYNRLRDLGDPVAKTLASYGAQVYSVNQPVEPLPPEDFNPYASDAESMMRGMNQIVSRWQISDLRRKHKYGVMARARRGLHPSGGAPYGYELRDKTLIVNPAQAVILREIKDLYLNGRGVPEIIRHLESKKVAPPKGQHWSDYGMRYMLRNPIYAGRVRLGYTRVENDPRTGKSTQVIAEPRKVFTETGKHEAIWDIATHEAILAEMKRRGPGHHKGPKTQRLSNLLFCADHDRPLRVKYPSGKRDDAHRIWYCPAVKGHWHLHFYDLAILAVVTDRIVEDLTKMQDRLHVPEVHDDELAVFLRARDDLRLRRERLTDALEQGTMDPPTYAERVERLDQQLTAIEENVATAAKRAGGDKDRTEGLITVADAIKAAPEIFAIAPAQEINAMLRKLIEKVLVHEHGLDINYR